MSCCLLFQSSNAVICKKVSRILQNIQDQGLVNKFLKLKEALVKVCRAKTDPVSNIPSSVLILPEHHTHYLENASMMKYLPIAELEDHLTQ